MVNDMRLVWGFDKTMSHFAEIILRYTNLNGEVGLDEVNIMKFNTMHDMKRMSSLPATVYQGIDILGDKVEKVIVFDCIVNLPFCFIICECGWIEDREIMKAQAPRGLGLDVYMSNQKITEINRENSIMGESRKRFNEEKKDKCAMDLVMLFFGSVLLQLDFNLDDLNPFENKSHQILKRGLTTEEIDTVGAVYQQGILPLEAWVDLTFEIEQALRDLDYICLFDSVAGSETVMKHDDTYGVPRLRLVNKIDHHGAAFFRTRDMTVTNLVAKPMAVLQRPIGVNDFLRGRVDLVKMKTTVWSVAESSYQNISMDLQESVKQCRALTIETIVQLVVMENYLEGGELEDEPFAELAFKIMSVSLIGSLTFARVYAGELTVGTYMLNLNKEKERKGHLLVMHANSRDNFKVALTCVKVALGLDGVDDTVGGIAEASMSMKFAKKCHPYLSTKNTILKRWGGRVKYIIHEVYEQNWKQKVEEEPRDASEELLGAANLPKPMPFFEAVSINLNETTSLQTAIAAAKLKYAHKFYQRSKEADFAFLVRYVISIFMFSVPRPPEVAELDREINLEAKEVHIMSFGQALVKNKVLHIQRKRNQSTLQCAEITNLEDKVFRRMEECCVLGT